ncbi:hypothetical protein [Salarchaeum sp. JOR-1]|uniref:DUF7546 family protein n=1 Tax=Salarchaeum sp. JOR-1 TaxID=2599399 RepID=UPI0011989FD7|nr:hypothetical protein [Salarchaeum sp. JOR-1]QDX40609.1 hypothetical protein FQU85_06730 [Salarchaeum sp. JOR-1]
MATRAPGVRDRFDPQTLAAWGVVVWSELTLVVFYLAITPGWVTEPRYVVYPFVWINLGLLAVLHTRRWVRDRDPAPRTRLVAGALAAGYFAVLATVGGLLFLPLVNPPHGGTTVSVSWVLPGWGPIVTARALGVQLTIVPFKAVGYLALSYVLYARLLDATRMVASAVLGLFSCVGCTMSLLVPLLGASTFAGATAYTWDASTLVYVVALATLYWSREIEAAIRQRLAR